MHSHTHSDTFRHMKPVQTHTHSDAHTNTQVTQIKTSLRNSLRHTHTQSLRHTHVGTLTHMHTHIYSLGHADPHTDTVTQTRTCTAQGHTLIHTQADTETRSHSVRCTLSDTHSHSDTLTRYTRSDKEKRGSVSRSVVHLFATPGTAAHQAPPSMGFSRQEYWSGFLSLPPGDLPDPGIKPRSPTLQADSLPSEPPGKPQT